MSNQKTEEEFQRDIALFKEYHDGAAIDKLAVKYNVNQAYVLHVIQLVSYCVRSLLSSMLTPITERRLPIIIPSEREFGREMYAREKECLLDLMQVMVNKDKQWLEEYKVAIKHE